MKNIIFFLSLLLFVNSCSENSTSPIIEANNKDELIPLKVGNKWTYDYGPIVADPNLNTSITLEISSEFDYKNEKHYRMQYTDNQSKQIFNDPFYYINKQDGFYVINDSGRTEPEVIKINYPTFKGEIIEEDDYTKRFVEETDYIYSTPIGKFKCIKYVTISKYGESIDSRADNYYSPGIGLIASELYRNNNYMDSLVLSSKRVITSYNLK